MNLGKVKPAGSVVSNPDLASTLTAIRLFGPNALYRGAIADKLVGYSGNQGGAFKLNELEGYPVDRAVPARVMVGPESVYMPPRRVGAGAYGAALLGRVVDAQGQVTAGDNPAAAIAIATKATLDQFGVTSLPRDLGATGFAATDPTGQAVSCAVTLNGAFGSGHTAAGTGVILARSPSTKPAGLSGAFLFPTIATSNDALQLVGAGAGGPNGTAAIAYALVRVALSQDITKPGDLHSTGLAPYDTINLIACQNGSCAALPDPGAQGLGAASAQ